MISPMHHLVGAQEIGTLLGVSRQRVHQLITRDDFPPPAVILGMGKVWHTEDVREWDQRRKERAVTRQRPAD